MVFAFADGSNKGDQGSTTESAVSGERFNWTDLGVLPNISLPIFLLLTNFTILTKISTFKCTIFENFGKDFQFYFQTKISIFIFANFNLP